MKNVLTTFPVAFALAFALIFAAPAATVLQNSSGSRALNILTLNTNANDGETFTINGTVFELDFNLSTRVTNGNTAIRLSTNGTRATRVLTLTNNAVNREQWTIAGKTYQADTTLTNTDGHVLLGADAAMTISNLFAAINADSTGAGSRFAAATTANSNVYASSLTSSTLTITADASGSQANSITVGRAWATNSGWASGDASGNSTLTGGAGAPSVSDPFLATNIVRGFNLSNRVQMYAQVVDTNQIAFFNAYTGNSSNACTETIAGATWSATTTYGGVSGDPIPTTTVLSRVPTADEVTRGKMHFFFPFPPRAVFVQVVVTSSGVPTAWVGAITKSGNRVTLDNSGATDWAATDTVNVLVAP